MTHPSWLDPTSWPLTKAWEKAVSAAMQQAMTDDRYLFLSWQGMKAMLDAKTAADRAVRTALGPWADVTGMGWWRSKQEGEGHGGDG